MSSSTPAPDDRERAFSACQLQVLQRGWLSSNNILFADDVSPALVDTGYAIHSAQTLALVAQRLHDRPLARIVNTHLHSDHCGGNAALQDRYPQVQTWIPEGEAAAVLAWDAHSLSYEATGQTCPRFRFDHVLRHGETLNLGNRDWQVHAAPGHDPHSVVLFQPDCRILISADALWENGFGVVFPELDGVDAFDDVAATLDVIDQLQPLHIIPGHGAPFSDVSGALLRARTRLARFKTDPDIHRRHGLKVLLKFKLLEWQHISLDDLEKWCRQTPYIQREMGLGSISDHESRAWLCDLIDDLCRSGAARLEHNTLIDQ